MHITAELGIGRLATLHTLRFILYIVVALPLS